MNAVTPFERAGDLTAPIAGLRAIASLRLWTEAVELRQVEAALRLEHSWPEIASALGVTRQAVHKRYAHRIDPTIAVRRRGRA